MPKNSIVYVWECSNYTSVAASFSVQPRDRIFVKGYGFLSFANNIGKNIGKNISKNSTGKYNQKCHAKQYASNALKTTSKK